MFVNRAATSLFIYAVKREAHARAHVVKVFNKNLFAAGALSKMCVIFCSLDSEMLIFSLRGYIEKIDNVRMKDML